MRKNAIKIAPVPYFTFNVKVILYNEEILWNMNYCDVFEVV